MQQGSQRPSSRVRWLFNKLCKTIEVYRAINQLSRNRYLAKDEMETINEDKWGEEVWGAATSPGTNSRDTAHSNLILYWGKHVSHRFE